MGKALLILLIKSDFMVQRFLHDTWYCYNSKIKTFKEARNFARQKNEIENNIKMNLGDKRYEGER
jgi:hypothetical protein